MEEVRLAIRRRSHSAQHSASSAAATDEAASIDGAHHEASAAGDGATSEASWNSLMATPASGPGFVKTAPGSERGGAVLSGSRAPSTVGSVAPSAPRPAQHAGAQHGAQRLVSVDEADGALGLLRTLLVQHNEQYGRTLREYEILLAQAEADRRRLEAAEPALERHAVGRAVAEAQLRLVQRQLVEAHAAQDGALAVQLRAADERLSVLGSQLRLSREAESALRHRLAATAAEAAQLRQSLQSSLEATTESNEGGAKSGGGGGGGEGGGGAEAELPWDAEERVRTWVETCILRGVLAASDLPSQVSAMIALNAFSGECLDCLDCLLG